MDAVSRRRARLAAWAAACIWMWLQPAGSSAQPVSFDEAIFAAEEHPEVRARQSELRTREELDRQIGGTAGATTVGASPGGRFTPDEERGFEGQFSLTQGWNLAGLGRARREAAGDERRALGADLRARALASRLEAARAWLDVRTLERLEALVEDQVSLARATAGATRKALSLGAATAADVADAEAFAAEMRRLEVAIEGELHHAAIRLSLAMGREPTGALRTRGASPEPSLPDQEAFSRYVERAGALPRAHAARLAAVAARARAGEAEATMGPTLTLGAQIQSEPREAWSALAVAGVSLNLFDRGMRARSAELGAAARLAGEGESAALEARAGVVEAIHALSHARAEHRVLDEDWLPSAERLVAQRKRAREVGAGTVFELLAAKRAEALVRGLHARASGAVAWAAVRLWLLFAEIERAERER